MAGAALIGTVVHLATGHVLAAVTAVGEEPSLDDVTGGRHLRVRFPGATGFVNVPVSLLTATRVALTADVLDRPQRYRLTPATPPLPPTLTLGPPPTVNGVPSPLPQGAQAVVVWQDGEDLLPAVGPIGASDALPGSPPPGATHQLLAYVGGGLSLHTMP